MEQKGGPESDEISHALSYETSQSKITEITSVAELESDKKSTKSKISNKRPKSNRNRKSSIRNQSITMNFQNIKAKNSPAARATVMNKDLPESIL